MVLEHAVAGPEADLAADHLVLGVVVAADLHLVDPDRHALGHLEDDVDRRRIHLRRDVARLDPGVGEAGVARPDRHLNPLRRVVEHLPAGDNSLLGHVARRDHRVLAVAREPGDGDATDLVLRPLLHLEDDVLEVALDLDLLGPGHRGVEIAVVAVDLGELVAALRQLVARDRLVGEPADRVPPRVVADRLPELGDRKLAVVVLGVGRDGAQEPGLDRVLGAVEHELPHLAAHALVDDEGDLRVVGGDDLDDRRDLGVGEVLLAVGLAHLRGRLGEVRLAVERAVAETGLLGDLGLAEELVAVHLQRRLEAHLALDVEDDVDVAGEALDRVGRDLLELAGRLERVDVASDRDRVVLGPRLGLAAARHRPRVAAEAVQRLDLDLRHLGGVRARRKEHYRQ